MTDYQTLLDACHKPFPWYAHEFLQQKFIYIRIQDTVLRLNSLGVPWSFEQGPVVIERSLNNTKPNKYNPEGLPQFDATTYGQLTIEGMGTRGAPGASTSTDKDNASKGAHSFALRKAASLFGISHYLMQRPAENTAFVNHMEHADFNSQTDLAKAVKLMAKCDNVDPVAAEIINHYGVTKESLGTVEGLRALLEKEGRM